MSKRNATLKVSLKENCPFVICARWVHLEFSKHVIPYVLSCWTSEQLHIRDQ